MATLCSPVETVLLNKICFVTAEQICYKTLISAQGILLVCVRIQEQRKQQNGPRNARFSSKAIKRKSIKVIWTVQRYWQRQVKQHSRCLQCFNWSSAGENSNLTVLLSVCVCWKENSSWMKVFFYWPHSLSVWFSAKLFIRVLKEAETWKKPEQIVPCIKFGRMGNFNVYLRLILGLFLLIIFSKCVLTPAKIHWLDSTFLFF